MGQGAACLGLRTALALSMLMIPASAVVGLLLSGWCAVAISGLALQANRMLSGQWVTTFDGRVDSALAGRYSEARTYLRRWRLTAKIRRGSQAPSCSSMRWFFPSKAKTPKAEELFEAAIQTPQANGTSISDLPTLLTRKDNSERARELVEAVLAGYPGSPAMIELRSTRSQMLAFHAWALAVERIAQAAESRMQEAVTSASAAGGRFNLAAMQLHRRHVGNAREREKARASYQAAVVQFPTAGIWLCARAARLRRLIRIFV